MYRAVLYLKSEPCSSGSREAGAAWGSYQEQEEDLAAFLLAPLFAVVFCFPLKSRTLALLLHESLVHSCYNILASAV